MKLDDLKKTIKKYNTPKNYQKVYMLSSKALKTYILIGLVFVIFYPFFFRLSLALRSQIDYTNPMVFLIPDNWTLKNFINAFNRINFPLIFKNTFILSLVTAIIQLFSTSMAGYAFSRLKFKGSNILFYLILFVITIPVETLHISRLLFFNNNYFFGIKLINNIFAIYIMSAFGMGIRSSILIYLFRQYFRSMPTEIEESAQLDGASIFGIYFKIALPYSKEALVTVGLFAFVWQWNDFYFPNLFNISSKGFPVFSSRFYHGRMQYINETSLLMMFPILIGYIIFQKIFLDSINNLKIC